MIIMICVLKRDQSFARSSCEKQLVETKSKKGGGAGAGGGKLLSGD